MESLKNRRHDEIVARWINARTPEHADYRKPDYDDSRIQSIKWAGSFPFGLEELQSYGSHFPLVQAIPASRKDRRTRLWLLNGDRWGGNGGWGMSTSGQQSLVRRLVAQTGIESIILPFSAIDAARIDHSSIRVLAQDEETWQSVTHTQAERPDDVEMVPKHEIIAETGYAHRGGKYSSIEWESFESIPESIRVYFDPDGSVKPRYAEPVKYRVSFGRQHRDYNTAKPYSDYATGPIQTRPGGKLYVPPVYRYMGVRASLDSKRNADGDWYSWERLESGEWRRTTRVHTLGQSVFRAAYTGANRKRYWANFLSGVDNTPHGSGYFLVQLPKNADVSSVASAIESLKPAVVVTAESYGLDVKRQGDLFAIPTDYSIRDLRRMGADIRQSSKVREGERTAIRERFETAFSAELVGLGIQGVNPYELDADMRAKREELRTRFAAELNTAVREWDAANKRHTERELYGTRHVGTDIAILPNGVMLARGTIRHTGGQHRYLSLGKVWHIVARNTVPLAR